MVENDSLGIHTRQEDSPRPRIRFVHSRCPTEETYQQKGTRLEV